MIAEILNHGEENTKGTTSIMALLGLSQREVVAQVSRERAKGTPILSSTHGGYYLPDDRDPEKALSEIRACERTISARGRHTLAALKAIRQEAEKLEDIVSGQATLKGV